MRQYHNVKLSDSNNADLDAKMEEILEQRRQEKELLQAEEMMPGETVESADAD
jgi:hypothetical protein